MTLKISINGEQTELQHDMTIAELLAHLDKDPKTLAVEVNRELVPRKNHAEHKLQTGDAIEIVTFVGGG